MNQKGSTVTELIVAMLLSVVVLGFIAQSFLYVNKRYIDWERDQDLAFIYSRTSQFITSKLEHVVEITSIDTSKIIFIDETGMKQNMAVNHEGLIWNGKNMMPKDASIESGSFTFKHKIGAPIISYNLAISNRKKVFYLNGSVTLKRYETTRIKGMF